MQQIKNLRLLIVSMVMVMGVATVPVAAEHGQESGTDDQATTTTAEQHSGGHGAQAVARTNTENQTETGDDNGGDVHKQGADLVDQLRQNHKEQSQAERQKKCEAHKQGLETKFDHIVTNSQRIQDKISGVLDKGVKYQQDKNLTVANFNSLVSAANDAKAKSADSITALQAVKPSLDCNNTSVATDVATFKTAATTTRDNLKAYRNAVKAVLQALEAAKPANTTEGSNQ
jgi:hypothetical protein